MKRPSAGGPQRPKALLLSVEYADQPVDVEGFLARYVELLLEERSPMEEVRDEGSEGPGASAA